MDMLAVRQGSLGHLRYVLKHALQYMPLYGWYFWMVRLLIHFSRKAWNLFLFSMDAFTFEERASFKRIRQSNSFSTSPSWNSRYVIFAKVGTFSSNFFNFFISELASNFSRRHSLQSKQKESYWRQQTSCDRNWSQATGLRSYAAQSRLRNGINKFSTSLGRRVRCHYRL